MSLNCKDTKKLELSQFFFLCFQEKNKEWHETSNEAIRGLL